MTKLVCDDVIKNPKWSKNEVPIYENITALSTRTPTPCKINYTHRASNQSGPPSVLSSDFTHIASGTALKPMFQLACDEGICIVTGPMW